MRSKKPKLEQLGKAEGLAIKGFFSSKITNEHSYIEISVYQTFHILYSSDNMQTRTFLYLEEMPSFEDVYTIFVNTTATKFKRDLQADMCLVLFYNPYFKELVARIHQDIDLIPRKRLIFLRTCLLNYLSDTAFYHGIFKFSPKDVQQLYLDNDYQTESIALLDFIRDYCA